MNPSAIETVVFDLGNVLVSIDDSAVFRRIARVSPKSEAELRASFEENRDSLIAFERGELNSVEYYQVMLQLIELDRDSYSYQTFRENWCSVVGRLPEMEQLFAESIARRTTCILSNTNDLHWSLIAERYGFVQRAHQTLVSYQCGFYKPDPGIYQVALKRFAIDDPATAVFIDDRPENIEQAHLAGMSASFVHEGCASTRERLVELGVLSGG